MDIEDKMMKSITTILCNATDTTYKDVKMCGESQVIAAYRTPPLPKVDRDMEGCMIIDIHLSNAILRPTPHNPDPVR